MKKGVKRNMRLISPIGEQCKYPIVKNVLVYLLDKNIFYKELALILLFRVLRNNT